MRNSPLEKSIAARNRGSSDFMWQRITSVINIFAGLYLLFVAFIALNFAHFEARHILLSPVLGALLLFSLSSVSFHMFLGMKMVIDDYVHGPTMRLVCHFANFFIVTLALTLAVWSFIRVIISN